MKVGPVMYHLNTFHYQENEGVSWGRERGGGGVEGAYKKPWKNAMNLTKSQL